MATLTVSAQRVLLAGSFAVAAAAAPILIAVAAPDAPAAPALATCPSTEVLDPLTGACKPKTDVVAESTSPIEPGVTGLAPGSITGSGNSGSVGQLPEINGIPCNGSNTGLCMGLQQENANAALTPNSPYGGPG